MGVSWLARFVQDIARGPGGSGGVSSHPVASDACRTPTRAAGNLETFSREGRRSMRRACGPMLFRALGLAVLLGVAVPAQAQDNKNPYPTMAPLDQYMMERDAEISLARSAGPASIAQDAQVMVLGKHGYEIAVTGKNGFVCIVERSWASEVDNPGFWNPKMRGPNCYNAAGARSQLPVLYKKTELILAGRTKEQMFEAISAAIDKKELPTPESGAMCYMLSKEGYLNDSVGHWHPHVMFFVPMIDPETWGANQPGSPLLGEKIETDRRTIFFLPVEKWSDGSADSAAGH
jgi:hypothetical protein